ncbi:MAG: lipase [Magnetococcales bacterium]|nr:lipase [Magnetococcales bacterium]
MQDIRICFVGDSFVNGTGDRSTLGWVGRLCAQAIGNFPLTCYNLGIRRDTSRDILNRWEWECVRRLPDDCDARIVFSCGVNDTVEKEGRLRVALQDSVTHIHNVLSKAKSYKVLFVGPPPVADLKQNQRIATLSQSFERVAEELNVPFIDLYRPLVQDFVYRNDVVANDGAHPTSEGYQRIAEIIAMSPLWWFHAPEIKR